MTDIKIDTDVPMPERETRPEYPFHKLEVGHSFFVEDKNYRQMQNRISHWRRKLGHSYASEYREENGKFGLRIWRTA